MRFLLWSLSVLVSMVAGLSGQTPERAPNVLLLFADDLRPDALGAFGGERVHTPNLDTLAERGARLTRIYCMGSQHGAVCVPSRAMLMSGRNLPRVANNLKDTVTLPELLRGRGYTTFMSGKWHNGKPALRRAFPDARSVFVGGMCDHFEVPLVDLSGGEFQSKEGTAEHSSQLFADATIQFLQGRSAEDAEPFFAYVSFTAPHDPRDPPPEWLTRLEPLGPPDLPVNFCGQHVLDLGGPTMMVRDEVLLGWPRSERMVREQITEYRALVAHLDHEIGRILEQLEASGLAEDTLVVFAADHGLAMGSHGLLGKQNLYEHSMRSPVVLAGPHVPAEVSRDGLGYVHDLFATICATAGVAVPPQAESRNLWPIVLGGESSRQDLLLLYAKTQRALRAERYKLIRLPQIDRSLLFDLLRDPHELHDLSEDPGYAEVLARLVARLQQAQRQNGDALPWTADNVRPAIIDLTGRGRKPDRWQPDWIVEKYFDQD